MYQLIAHHEYEALANLLNEAPELNAHFSAMLIRHGFQNEHMQTWVRFKGDLMIGALSVYRGGAVVYERERPIYKDLLDMLAWNSYKSLSGPSYVIDAIRSQKPYLNVENTTVARLDTLEKIQSGPMIAAMDKVDLEPYTRKALSEKIKLQNSIFSLQVDQKHEGIFQLFDHKILKGYVVKHQDQIVATGEWLNNHPTFGLILGIATREDQRRKYYAQCISARICLDIVDRGKTPLLRYQEFEAGLLYKKLGFIDVAQFSTIYF